MGCRYEVYEVTCVDESSSAPSPTCRRPLLPALATLGLSLSVLVMPRLYTDGLRACLCTSDVVETSIEGRLCATVAVLGVVVGGRAVVRERETGT